VHVRDAHIAWVVSTEAAARDTTTVRAHPSNGSVIPAAMASVCGTPRMLAPGEARRRLACGVQP
jgi:hypothetical protein